MRSGARLLQSPKGTSGSERQRDASCIAQAFRLPRLPNRIVGGMVRQPLARQPKLYERFLMVCQKWLPTEGKHGEPVGLEGGDREQPWPGIGAGPECNPVATVCGGTVQNLDL